MKRRKSIPDKRLNWRDKNMPVLMRASFDGGKTFQLTEIEPEAVTKYYENKMLNGSLDLLPSWRNDPTYDLRRKR